MENVTKHSPSQDALEFTFSWYDYTLFSLVLGLSVLIGIYFGLIKKQLTSDEYLLGGKKMSAFPVAMSQIASSISGVTLLAIPADVYRYGVTYWFAAISVVFVIAISHFLYLPVFYKLQLTSMYEYFKLRFDTKTRIFTSLLFTISMALLLPIVIYIPALAFSQATNINTHYITPLICGICIFYTTLGGLKAVIWTDTLQLIIMVGAMIAVFTIGIITNGGFANIWQKSLEGQRLDIDFDVTKRETFWTGTFGTLFVFLHHVSLNQGYIQKCLSLPTYKAVGRANIMVLFGLSFGVTSSVFTGLIMFARYTDCDPITTGKVKQSDQLLPFYVLDVASFVPGLPGLFTAGIFSAALSTMSSALNCLSGTIYEDFVSPFMPKNISQKRVSTILKCLVIVIGIACTGLVFIVEQLGSLMPLAFSLYGVTGGPLLGLFTVGILFPIVNAKGAFYGGVSSLILMAWLVLCAQWYKMKGIINYPVLPLSTDGCNVTYNITHTVYSNVLEDLQHKPLFLYEISYYYYNIIGCLIVIIVSVPVSLLTKKDKHLISRDTFSPFVHFLLPKENSAPYLSIENGLNILNKN